MKTKNLLLLALVLLCSYHSKAQSYACSFTPGVPVAGTFVIKDIVADFGAIPNDGLSDQLAFEAAFDFFQNNYIGGTAGHGMLTIPGGTYNVGAQDLSCNGQYLFGHQVFVLSDAEVFTIKGIPVNGVKPIIQYDPCLRFGSFDPITGQRYLAWPRSAGYPGFCDPLYLATLGDCFEFYRSRLITITDVELDGNIDQQTIGGYWAADFAGIQAAHDGIFLQSCTEVKITNVDVHHFGKDGIHIESDQSVKNIATYIENCNFNWNCRDGLTWGGGSNLRVVRTNCNFNGWGPFTSLDCSGIAIELREPGTSADISKGVFENVNAEHNYYSGLLANSNLQSDPQIYDFQFRGCRFVGSHETGGSWLIGFAAFPEMRLCTFESCQFYGYTTRPWQNPTFPNDGAHFNNCIFSDVYQNELYCSGSWGDLIVNMGPLSGSVPRFFDRCVFERHCGDAFTYSTGGDIVFTENDFFDFSSPTITYVGNFCVDQNHFFNNSNDYFTPSTWFWQTCPGPLFSTINTIPATTVCPPIYLLPVVPRPELFCPGCVYNDGKNDPLHDCIPVRSDPDDGKKHRMASQTFSNSSMMIMPNPAGNKVFLSGINANNNIFIYNVFGKQVLNITSTGYQTEIDISSLTPGIYFISNENQFVGKLIKE